MTLLRTLACSALAIGMAASSAPLVAQDSRYGYCTVKIGSSTQLSQVVSSVYRVPANTYHVGVANSFRDHVDANFPGGASASPNCDTSMSSWQEAEDSRNDHIGRLKRSSWTVHQVRWAYYGD